MATPPREIHKNELCFITVRAVNRCFRFVPDRRTTATIWYCLAATLDEFKGRIAAHEVLFMSNHFHLVMTDIEGCGPDFANYLDSILSRALNATRGSTGSNIEKGYSRVVVHDDDKLVEHCVYTLANPCKADLVARSRHWKGVSSLTLDYGIPVTIERPRFGLWAGKPTHTCRKASERSKRARYAGRSSMPERVELVLSRPPVMPHLSDIELRVYIRRQLEETELKLIRERKSNYLRVVGWDKVVKQNFMATPRSEERFGRNPSFSASRVSARVEATRRRWKFLEAYATALNAFQEGTLNTAFPERHMAHEAAL